MNLFDTDKRRFVVFGCGPAGLLAAHAGVQLGYEVVIYSKKRKSEMYGAQYLHQPIPGLRADRFEVVYLLDGNIKDYRSKVYAGTHVPSVSPEDVETAHLGWDIRQAYTQLWNLYGGLIIDHQFDDPMEFVRVVEDNDDGNTTFASTIPAPSMCLMPDLHAFSATEIWAIGDAPERGIFSPVTLPSENTVLCNGNDAPRWYRASNIQGYHTVEWPGGSKPPIEGISPVTKPIGTTCVCHPKVRRLGRYGRWQKGVLAHEAYTDAYVGLGGTL